MSVSRYRVCFVCTGNICRSPMAESVFRRALADRGLDGRVVVASAGTGGWHTGEPADPRATAALLAAGYDAGHTARQFRVDWFGRYDLVVALDRGHQRQLLRMAPTDQDILKIRLLRSFDPAAGPDGPDGPDVDVPDPYYGPDSGFEECLELIEAAMPGLLEAVAEQLGEPLAEKDPTP
ncbi:low molecular weight protein-tyrosine-phosphatase [Streptomyces aidingensis]|uniref:protein-tyrosine-phosphatase n=1 Tax=Streptomyces aidingensis TaxID=910347 RepID=A0A1I1QHC7_9ACTN|nr:low molecular weight protein-tyrosine-phosphatase [Streptomyces aidingensis]SFD21554.1 protein-tyrosine phosphatase [Streptomyces aidingensis]